MQNILSTLFLYVLILRGIGQLAISSIVKIVNKIGDNEYNKAEVGVKAILLLVISFTLSVTHWMTPQGLTTLGLLRDWDNPKTARSVKTRNATLRINLK